MIPSLNSDNCSIWLAWSNINLLALLTFYQGDEMRKYRDRTWHESTQSDTSNVYQWS